MSDAQSTAPRPRKRNWLKILLIISVSINLLIAGAIISRFVAVKRMIQAQGMGAPGLMLRQSRYMMRTASRERRLELRGIIGPHRKVLSKSRDEIGRQRAGIARLLQAGTLDRDALRAALKQLNEAEDKAHMTVTGLREDFLLAMTADERRKFAEGMLSRRHWRDRGHRGPRGDWGRR